LREVLHLDLFSGIGGFSLAAEAVGFETVAFCEIDPEANLVTAHHWPNVPNLLDIRTVTRERYPDIVPDLITGGVPCQPASALGLMRGTSDERWLWPDTIRIMREFRPSFGIFENPPALLTLESGDAWNGILSGLVACGYDCLWDVFPAAAFGAGHLRERIILVCVKAGSDNAANAAGICPRGEADAKDAKPNGRHAWLEPASGNGGAQRTFTNASCESFGCPSDGEIQAGRNTVAVRGGCGEAPSADTNGQGLQGHAGNGADGLGRSGARRPIAPPDLRGRVTGADWWHEAHTGIPVLATGIPGRVVEAVSRCIGNSVVPQVLMPVMEAIAATFK
jgi:DNA (cytosine-5)-methyltransferase 1